MSFPGTVDSAFDLALPFISLPLSHTMSDGAVHNRTNISKSEHAQSSIPDRHKLNDNARAEENGPAMESKQASSSKRKLEDTSEGDTHSKIRRVVRERVVHLSAMTTVICSHAAVAQKSYGTEKRFLCPPPVVRIEGPTWHLQDQQLSMVVVSEIGERSFEQKAPLDGGMTCSFKSLHVGGTAKAKSFQLSLEVAEPSPHSVSEGSEEGSEPPPGRTWATFDSAPVSIISKPSKKTAKTRNIASCILAGGPVSLFNRINSQTVRTKYMTIDGGQLCASNGLWSAFSVTVVRRPGDQPPTGGPSPVTYGCEIVLVDDATGVPTPPLIIRKVDKGRVLFDDGGPVSQMQKIVLLRVNMDGTRHYLSASTPVNGNPGSPTGQSGVTHQLLFQAARTREEAKDGMMSAFDEVDDYLCWTIVGISKFQYTFFDAFDRGDFIPSMPITPFPTLFSAPIYRAQDSLLELTASHFFYEHPITRGQVPLDVFIGSLGPLSLRLFHPNPPGPLVRIQTYPTRSEEHGDHTAPLEAFLPTAANTVVMVELPPIENIMKALRDSDPAVAEASTGNTASGPGSAPPTPASFLGRAIPLLFVRAADGVGYHSGRTIICESLFHPIPLPDPAMLAANGQTIDTNWLVAQTPVATTDSPLHGWTLRVI